MILTILLYAALLLFFIGIMIRIVRIAAMPVHVRWELYPAPESNAQKLCIMTSEIFLLKGIFQHNRSLWLCSWLFHVSLYMLIGVAGLSVLSAAFGQTGGPVARLIEILSFAAFGCGIVGTTGLLALRFSHSRLRPYTSFAVIFNLTVLFAIFLSGMAHMLLQPSAGSIMVAQAGSLLRLNPAPRMHPASAVHLCLMAFFAAYFPFTQMAHAVMKYFTYHSVRWDTQPARQMTGHPMSRYLAFPVRWLAPHIRQSEKEKTYWFEIIHFKK